MLKVKLNNYPLSALTIPLHAAGLPHDLDWCAETRTWYVTSTAPETELWLLFNLPHGVEVLETF